MSQPNPKNRLDRVEARKAKLRPRNELIFNLDFIVKEVSTFNHATSIMPNSERRFGGRNSSYPAGYTQSTSLSVVSRDEEIPIEELTFEGYLGIVKDDHIRAKIPCYENDSHSDFLAELTGMEQSQSGLYLPRDFNVRESAIEVVTFSANWEAELRRDTAANYSKI